MNQTNRMPAAGRWCLLLLLPLFTLQASAGGKAPEPNPLLNEQTFVVFDVETTGLSAEYERIVELGAVKIEHGRITDQKSWLINPRKRISDSAQKVHGIDYDMIKDERTFKTTYPEIADFFGDAVLMAHNARFDRDFLYAEVSNNGLTLPGNPVVDTLRLFRAWYPGAESHSLGALADMLKVSGGTFHRGLDDSVYAAEIFLRGMNLSGAPRTMDELLKVGGLPDKPAE